MKTLEWKFEDNRRHWLPEARNRIGPWDQEPDKRQWMDAATGFPCLIVRNYQGALCGYVGVAAGHPWYGKNYDDVDSEIPGEEYVHSGLTFAGPCGEKICHEVEPGENADVWWLGFHCAHAFDFVPGFELGRDEEYRDMAYVTAECEKLAAVASGCLAPGKEEKK